MVSTEDTEALADRLESYSIRRLVHCGSDFTKRQPAQMPQFDCLALCFGQRLQSLRQSECSFALDRMVTRWLARCLRFEPMERGGIHLDGEILFSSHISLRGCVFSNSVEKVVVQ